jgi:DNA polymerase-3 subunit epsilon
MKVITDLSYPHSNFFVLGKGRKPGEKSVIWVENGSYRGFGYFEDEFAVQSLDFLKQSITTYPDNRDIQSLLRSNMRKVIPKNIIIYQPQKEQDTHF